MFASLSLLPLPSSFRENEKEKSALKKTKRKRKREMGKNHVKHQNNWDTSPSFRRPSARLSRDERPHGRRTRPPTCIRSLISLALVTREIDEGVSADDYKIYTYFVAAIGAVAMAEVLFSASKLITNTKETGLDFYLEISLGLIVSISAIVIYHMVTMLYSLSPRSVPKMKGGGGGGRDRDEDDED